MDLRHRISLRGLLLALPLTLLGTPLHAQQDFPNRPIRIILGYAAGTGVDTITRAMASKLGPISGQPVIIENKPGAQTNIAAEYVAKSKPDGYTLFVTAGNSTFAANAYLMKTLPFDPLKSFAPITTLANVPFLLLSTPAQPIQTVSDLTRLLKEKGAGGSYAASTPFGVAITELYKSIAGVDAVQIPYRSLDQAAPELMSGAVDFMITDIGTSISHIQGKRVRPIAITTARRSSSMPELPTMIESGVPGFDVSAWVAAYAPAGTPRPIVEKLYAWIDQIMATDDLKKVLANIHYESMPSTPDELTAFHASEVAKWGKLMKAAKIPQQ